MNNVNNNPDSDNICSRLRSRKRTAVPAAQPRQPQRKKQRRTNCIDLTEKFPAKTEEQPDYYDEADQEDNEVILNKADEIESLQVRKFYKYF